MLKRLSTWYENLRPIEYYIVPNSSRRTQNSIRATVALLVALPPIIFIESYFINQPWRNFGPVDLDMPAPTATLDAGQPWPDAVPVTLLSELLPDDAAQALPADAAVPRDQDRLTVFSVVEPVQSINKPVSQSWLSRLTNPEGEPVTTKVALWCGFDLQELPAVRFCTATFPVPIFGRVIAGACLSRDGFALHQTLLRTEICEQSGHENICSRLAEWNTSPPRPGDKVDLDGELQCSASIILPHLTFTMTSDAVRVSTETISPFVDSFSADAEHKQGFTRSLTVLTHDASNAGFILWKDFVDASGAIPVSITSPSRAVGLFWKEYRSRYDIKRGNNASMPTRERSVFLGEVNIPLQAPTSLVAAAQFLGHELPIPDGAINLAPNVEALNLPEVCQVTSTPKTAASDAQSFGESHRYLLRLSQTVCPEEVLGASLIDALLGSR